MLILKIGNFKAVVVFTEINLVLKKPTKNPQRERERDIGSFRSSYKIGDFIKPG